MSIHLNTGRVCYPPTGPGRGVSLWDRVRIWRLSRRNRRILIALLHRRVREALQVDPAQARVAEQPPLLDEFTTWSTQQHAAQALTSLINEAIAYAQVLPLARRHRFGLLEHSINIFSSDARDLMQEAAVEIPSPPHQLSTQEIDALVGERNRVVGLLSDARALLQSARRQALFRASQAAAHVLLGLGVLAAELSVVFTVWDAWLAGTPGYTLALIAGLTMSTILALAFAAGLARGPNKHKSRAGWILLYSLTAGLGMMRAYLIVQKDGLALLASAAPAILLIPPLVLLSEPRFCRAAALLREARQALEDAAVKAAPLRRRAIPAAAKASAEAELRGKLAEEQERMHHEQDALKQGYAVRARSLANQVLDLEEHLFALREEIAGQTLIDFQPDTNLLARQLADWQGRP